MRSTNNRRSALHLAVMTLLVVCALSGSAAGVSLTLPDTTIQTGMTFTLPLHVDQVDGLGIISYQFSLHFNGEILRATGVSIDNCLSEPWGDPTVNTAVSGEITVVHYGVTPLSGSGHLILIHFQVVGNPGEMTQLRFDPFLFNEGYPSADISDPAAMFNVTSSNVPILSVTPETLSYGEIDTVQILTIINIGTDTLEWSISEIDDIPWLIGMMPTSGRGDDVITISISRSGMNVGTYSGRVLVNSNGGRRNIILSMVVPQESFLVDISIPDTSQYKSRRVHLPVRIGDVTGMNIIAYDCTLLFDKNVINIVGASSDSTLSEGWEPPDVNTDTTGQITVSHFGSVPLTGRGTLISFICIAVGNPGDTSTFIFEHFVFNDGYPLARWATPAGIFSVDTADVPLLFLSPTILDFGSDETVRTFDIVNLGTDTLVWNIVEDPKELWITSILPSTGVGEATISVAVTRIGLSTGLYSGKISVLSNGGNGSATVSISVPSGERSIGLSLPDTTAVIGDEIFIPVMVNDDLTTFGIIDYQFALHFREDVVAVIDARGEATLSEPWGRPVVDISTPGRAHITHKGLLPLTGAGPLIMVRIRAMGMPEDVTPLSFSDVLMNGNNAVARFDTPAGTFTVERPDHPLLSVLPATLNFGTEATSRALTISNLGVGELRWSVYESPVDVDWITSVSPADGVGAGTVTVTVERSDLLPDVYIGGLYVASNGGFQNIGVRMVVEETDTLPPYLAFSSPQEGAPSVARNGFLYLVLDDLDSEVDRNTITVVVDADTVVSEGLDQTGGAIRFLGRDSGVGLVYMPAEPFDRDYEVVVSVRAEDTAFPPHLYEGHFSYHTGSSTIDVRAQAMIGSNGGTVADAGGVLVTLPSGALDDSLIVFVGTVSDPPPFPDTLVSVGSTYVFGPEELDFCFLPGVGRLTYTDEDLDTAKVSDPFQLMVFRFVPGSEQWEELQILDIDPDAKIVLFNLCRLGYFSLGTSHPTFIADGSVAGDIPVAYRLFHNHPNPFNSSTHIPVGIPARSGHAEIRVSIYNLLGESVRTLFQGNLPTGHHTLIWDARADNGHVVPSGVYICRMSARDAQGSRFGSLQQKMLFLK